MRNPCAANNDWQISGALCDAADRAEIRICATRAQPITTGKFLEPYVANLWSLMCRCRPSRNPHMRNPCAANNDWQISGALCDAADRAEIRICATRAQPIMTGTFLEPYVVLQTEQKSAYARPVRSQ